MGKDLFLDPSFGPAWTVQLYSAQELNLIKALATETTRDWGGLMVITMMGPRQTLLGARCAGQLWVYLDGTRVPEEIIGTGCSNGQLLCVEGKSIAACEGAKKIACQIPRLYTCKSEVAVPKSVREIGEAQKAMDSALCTTQQAWSGYKRGPNEKPECFEEGKTVTQECNTGDDLKKTVMCETKFA
eukprot:s1594_g2.t1